MRLGLSWAGVTFGVAISYLTLVVFALGQAERFAGIYAVVVFLLALGNLRSERRAR